jgi:hypothetical protein
MITALRPHIALIRRDLRATAGFMILILAINVLYSLIIHSIIARVGVGNWQLFVDTHKTFSSIDNNCYLFFKSEVFIFAAFFAVIINLEWNTTTLNQTLFLPVRKYSHLLLMMVAIWVFGWFIISIPSILSLLHYLIIKQQLSNLSSYYAHYFYKDLFSAAQELFLLSGMVCFAQGVMTAINRYRFTVWALTFVTAAAAYTAVFYRVNHGLYFGNHPWGHSAFYGTTGWEIGAIFFLIGLFLYDRYAEV